MIPGKFYLFPIIAFPIASIGAIDIKTITTQFSAIQLNTAFNILPPLFTCDSHYDYLW